MKTSPLLFCLAMTCTPALAFAQPPDIAKKEAQQRFDEGNAAYAAGKHEEARIKFTQAWATLKRPNVLFNLARSEQMTGHLVDASRHYRAYARMNDPKISGADKSEAEKRLAELREKVGRVMVSAPKGTTTSIDGERVDEADLEGGVEVEPGKHKVSGVWGNKNKDVEVTAVAGRTATVSFMFEETSAPTTTAAPVTPPPPPDHVTPPPAEEKSTNVWPIVGWTALGVGVVTAGVGLGFVFASNSAADDRDRLKAEPGAKDCPAASPVCTQLVEAVDARTSRANVATALLIGGGAFVIGGTAILLFKPGRASASGVAPVVTPSFAGFAAHGTF